MASGVIERLAVIGVGLIGGSLARALRESRACRRVIGYDRDQARLARARALGVLDDWAPDLGAAVAGADAVVVAVPIGAIRAVFEGIRAGLRPEALVTDVGSVKATVVADARAVLGAHLPYVVPGHPIAGAEHSGVEASSAGLFHGQRVILTPLAETAVGAVARARAMWEATGAVVELMEAERHDQILAATSHLPHALACALVNAVTRMKGPDAALRYGAGGYGDLTRIASGNPALWHDIFLANREYLIEALAGFSAEVEGLRQAIAGADGAALLTTLGEAKTVRDAFAAERPGKAPAPPRSLQG